MRRIKATESVAGVIALTLIVAGIRLSVPKTFNRVLEIQSVFLKTVLLLAGALLMIVTVASIVRNKTLFTQRRLVNFCLLAASTIVCLAVFEVILQVGSSGSCKRADSLLDHSYTPDCTVPFSSSEWTVDVSINSDGLRDDDFRNASLRILVLGDSFTWGYGVEHHETYTELLEGSLNEQGIDAEVINAGVTSYSPSLEYLYLKHRGLKYRPQVILLTLDMSDVQDDYIREQEGIMEEGFIISVPKKEAEGMAYIRKNIKFAGVAGGVFKLIDGVLPPPDHFDEKLFGEVRFDRYAITRSTPMKDEAQHWSRTLKYIKAIDALARATNSTLVVTTHPYGHQVSGDEWASGRHLFGFTQGEVYSSRAESILADYTERHGILFVPTFERFKAEARMHEGTEEWGREELLFFPYDGHFTPMGHQVMAESLVGTLLHLVREFG